MTFTRISVQFCVKECLSGAIKYCFIILAPADPDGEPTEYSWFTLRCVHPGEMEMHSYRWLGRELEKRSLSGWLIFCLEVDMHRHLGLDQCEDWSDLGIGDHRISLEKLRKYRLITIVLVSHV